MSVPGKKLAGKMVSGGFAPPSAPSAPSAPRAQPRPGTPQHSSLSGGYSPTHGFKNPPGVPKGPTFGNKDRPRVTIGPDGKPVNVPKPDTGYKPPTESVTPNGPAPEVSPTASITDPLYWQSRMALGQDYGLSSANALVEQTLADNAYLDESRRQKTDFDRGRRNLAESLLGKGSAVYSGMHQRDRTEGLQDFIQNTGRLDDDYKIANYGREAERTDIDARLAPEVGSEYVRIMNEWHEREAARDIDEAESAAPDYRLGRKARVRSLQKQIKTMRERVNEMEAGPRRKKLRGRIAKKRKALRELKAKGS